MPIASYDTPDPERPNSAAPTEAELKQEMPGGSESAGHDPYSALRYSAFRRYIAGVTLSELGQQMRSATIGWEVAIRSSRPALALSLVGLLGAAPVILLALPAGHLADTVDRKKLTIAALLLGAISSIGLAVVSFLHAPLFLMFAILLLASTIAAIGGPAQSTLRAQIVPIELFSNATTWTSSCFQIASMVGPALAGGIIAIQSVHLRDKILPTLPLAYLFDAVCGLAFVALLSDIRLRPAQLKTETASLKTLLAGIRFVRINNIILATITLDLFAVLLGGATYLLPIYAKDVLKVGAVGFGWMRAAPAIGALGMGLLVAHLPPMKKAGRNLLFAVTGFGLATIIFGLSKSFTLSLIMLFLTGAFDNISVVVRSTLVQVLTPDAMRGRVSAVNNVFIGASNELGGFESGLTAQLFGPIWSVVAGGIGTILVVLAVNTIWPQVRRFGSLADARPAEDEALPRGFEVIQKAADA
jgi:MFS family permease